jgi:predicted glycoside hydrolase/deacetylase ChbG (UPF0249 family)
LRNVIFTADDYGAVPQIDEGIQSAVRNRKINSVAIFSNIKKTMEDQWRNRVIDLLIAGEEAKKEDPHYQLEIGIHLSLTSGFAVYKREPSFCKHGSDEFKSIYHFNFIENTDVLYNEIEAQYEKLADLLADVYENPALGFNYRIMHLSSHRNILSLHRSHFTALMALAKGRNVPIRSPVVYPSIDSGLYKRFAMVRNLENNGSRTIRKIREYREDFFVDFDKERSNLKKPDLVDASHRGPITFFNPRRRLEESRILKKKCDLLTALEKKQHWAFTREFVFHLIKDDSEVRTLSKIKEWVKDYPGMEYRDFLSHALEYKSLMSLTSDEMEKAKVQFCRWVDL